MFYNQFRGTRPALRWLLVASLLCVCILSLALSVLSVATYDDFCRGAWSKDIGDLFGRVSHEYSTLSGRWAAHALYALIFPHLDVTSFNYNLLVLLSGPAWFVVFGSFLHIFFRLSMSWADKAVGAAILTAIYWVGLPGADETWYWMAGSVEYQLPFLLLALSLLLLSSAWVTRSTGLTRWASVLAGCLVGFLVTGFSELCGVLLVGCLSVAVFLAATRRRLDLVSAYGLVLLVVLGGLALNLSAPGIAARSAQDFPAPNNLPYALKSLVDPDISPLAWLGDARLICLALFLATSSHFAKLRPEWTGWKLPLPGPLSSMAVFAPLAGLAAVTGMTFAVSYAMGPVPPPRVFNLIYAALVIGVTGALAPIGRLLQDDFDRPGARLRAINLAAAVLLPVTLLIAPTTLKAIKQLPSIATQWRPQVDARHEEIVRRVAAGEREIVLKPIDMRPETYFWEDIRSNPRYWRNQCMADYYGADGLSIPPPVSPTP